MERESLTLRYEGPSITKEGMESKHVADSIRGFGDFLSRVGREIHGENAKQKTVIRSIRPGSIEIDFAQILTDGSTQLVITAGMEAYVQYASLIKDCFDLFKHLGGEPPKSVKNIKGNMSVVENNHGDIYNVNVKTLHLTLDYKAGKAVKEFVKEPLYKAAKSMQILQDGELVASASNDDADCFIPIDSEDVLFDNDHKMAVTIVSVVFKGKAQWKFTDGQSVFSAEIEDKDFLAEVDAGAERFGKGDILVVEMRTIQKKTSSGLKSEYIILKVLEHRMASDRPSKFL